MPLSAKYLPRATPFDPEEDPPGSVDPLGTLGLAERIAEVLFPGFTARMWRPRFLTFSAVVALVAEQSKTKLDGYQDGRLEARLGFERLFVSAVIRQEVKEPYEWKKAVRRLPGSLLAKKALSSGDLPLGKNNFLKGQAVNGPYGVIARLARNLEIIDDDDCLGRSGEGLLIAWSVDQGLVGILDEEESDAPGKKWLNRFVEENIAYIDKNSWRNPGWSGWQDLAEFLRPDKIGGKERIVLQNLLNNDSIRARCLELMCEPNSFSMFFPAKDQERGVQDRRILVQALLPALSPKKHEEDRIIDFTIRLADVYEEVTNYLEIAFNTLRWGLTHRGGQSSLDQLEGDKELGKVLSIICQRLEFATHRLSKMIDKIQDVQQLASLKEPLESLMFQSLASAESPSKLIQNVVSRHREVQSSKGKAMWIDVGDKWTLLPGFGLVEGPPEISSEAYLHPFRVPNVYSFLRELGLIELEVPDDEEK